MQPSNSNPVDSYAGDLLTLKQAGLEFQMGRTSLYKFRLQHGIPLLTGGKVHRADMIRGFEAERSGRRGDVAAAENKHAGDEGTRCC